jgi:hypothetical protein
MLGTLVSGYACECVPLWNTRSATVESLTTFSDQVISVYSRGGQASISQEEA